MTVKNTTKYLLLGIKLFSFKLLLFAILKKLLLCYAFYFATILLKDLASKFPYTKLILSSLKLLT